MLSDIFKKTVQTKFEKNLVITNKCHNFALVLHLN